MIVIGSDEWTALKSYMHLEEMDDTSDDAKLVQSFHAAAVRYLAGAGVTAERITATDEEDDMALYQLTLQAMTLDMYDNRGSYSGSSAAGAAIGVRAWINQLKAVCLEGFV